MTLPERYGPWAIAASEGTGRAFASPGSEKDSTALGRTARRSIAFSCRRSAQPLAANVLPAPWTFPARTYKGSPHRCRFARDRSIRQQCRFRSKRRAVPGEGSRQLDRAGQSQRADNHALQLSLCYALVGAAASFSMAFGACYSGASATWRSTPPPRRSIFVWAKDYGRSSDTTVSMFSI